MFEGYIAHQRRGKAPGQERVVDTSVTKSNPLSHRVRQLQRGTVTVLMTAVTEAESVESTRRGAGYIIMHSTLSKDNTEQRQGEERVGPTEVRMFTASLCYVIGSGQGYGDESGAQTPGAEYSIQSSQRLIPCYSLPFRGRSCTSPDQRAHGYLSDNSTIAIVPDTRQIVRDTRATPPLLLGAH
jgi:hypothetical protein